MNKVGAKVENKWACLEKMKVENSDDLIYIEWTTSSGYKKWIGLIGNNPV